MSIVLLYLVFGPIFYIFILLVRPYMPVIERKIERFFLDHIEEVIAVNFALGFYLLYKVIFQR